MGDGDKRLTDKALAVFAFAAYHQLGSGQPVTSVVRDDGGGHRADEAALAELGGEGYVKLNGNQVAFTERGSALLSTLVDALRREAVKRPGQA